MIKAHIIDTIKLWYFFQRQLMEAYIKQKRQDNCMVQANDLPLMRPTSVSRNGRELHAYDGPMQFMMSPDNPDQEILSSPTSPYNEGRHIDAFLLRDRNLTLFSSV
jgi:hypothetical protein